MNDSVYFPLRSNTDFFEMKSKQPTLINRIKQSLLMYENLIFEPDMYTLTCNEFGVFDSIGPSPEKGLGGIPEVPIEKTSIRGMFNDGTEFPIIPAGNGRHYTVCFQDILENLGLSEESFIQYQSLELTDSGKNILNKVIQENEEYKKLINLPNRCQDQIFENFNRSLMASNYLGAPIMIDSLHDKIMAKLSHNNIKYDLRLNVLNEMLDMINKRLNDLQTPDFSAMGTDDLLDLRKQKLFKKFRSKLLEINTYLTEKDAEKLDETKIQLTVAMELLSEYGKQMAEIHPSREKVIIRTGVGVVGTLPVVGNAVSALNLVYDTAEQIKNLYHYENSWLAFIFQYQG